MGTTLGRLLYSDSHGDSYIENIMSDNATTGVQIAMTASHVPATAEASGYTGDGLRAWKADAYGRTYYLYDGTDPVAELDGAGNLQATNTFGAQGLVSRHTTATNASVFYAFDERGNVAQRLNSSGSVLSTDLYDAFGARTGTAPATDPWGFGAQWGYQTDGETGLVLCTNRFYDPQQGRFLTRDPLGYAGGVNLYGYVGNNPVNSVDPLGLHLVPDPDVRKKFWKAISYLEKFPGARKVINGLIHSDTDYHIQSIVADNGYNPEGALYDNSQTTIFWDPTASFSLDTRGSLSPALILAHELDHAYHYDRDPILADLLLNRLTGTTMDNEEEARTIVYFENPAARFFSKDGNGVRHDHRLVGLTHVSNPTKCVR